MSEMLKVDRLYVSYGAIQALRGVSLEVETGEIVAILGANGAGKSTLLRAISGMLRPRSGSIVFNGHELRGQRPARIARSGAIHVPEGRQILTRLTVFENLQLGALARRDGPFIEKSVQPIFDLFPRLAERRDQLAGTLSGGEQQMLAIGRGLMAQPRLLMLDEPSMGLAPTLVYAIFTALREISHDVTILLVEQNVRAALDLANRGYLLESGQVVRFGRAEDLTEESIQAAYLGSVK